jgi:hypothetical protein
LANSFARCHPDERVRQIDRDRLGLLRLRAEKGVHLPVPLVHALVKESLDSAKAGIAAITAGDDQDSARGRIRARPVREARGMHRKAVGGPLQVVRFGDEIAHLPAVLRNERFHRCPRAAQ